jgi:hypothetical protein
VAHFTAGIRQEAMFLVMVAYAATFLAWQPQLYDQQHSSSTYLRMLRRATAGIQMATAAR